VYLRLIWCFLLTAPAISGELRLDLRSVLGQSADLLVPSAFEFTSLSRIHLKYSTNLRRTLSMSQKHIFLHFLTGTAVFLGIAGYSASSHAQMDMNERPVLVITNETMPGSTPDPRYQLPAKAPEITPEQVSGASYFEPTETIVGQKIDNLQADLFSLQSRISNLSQRLNSLHNQNQALGADYNAAVATINTQLQAGTTPGNPRLVQRLNGAQRNMDMLAQNVADLNGLAVEVANAASMSSFLLDTIRSTFSLSGAVEEDHVRLAQLEDQVSNTIVSVDRLLDEVNDSISRTAAYLNAERQNLRTLSLAISKGDLLGRSLASRPFSNVSQRNLMQPASAPAPAMAAPAGPRPLVKIRFDKPNVNYEQPVFMAVSEAMERYPQSTFEVVAVHPASGNAAQVAIESTRSRRNAEQVLRTLNQMGLQADKIDLSYMPSQDVASSEVHIFIR